MNLSRFFFGVNFRKIKIVDPLMEILGRGSRKKTFFAASFPRSEAIISFLHGIHSIYMSLFHGMILPCYFYSEKSKRAIYCLINWSPIWQPLGKKIKIKVHRGK